MWIQKIVTVIHNLPKLVRLPGTWLARCLVPTRYPAPGTRYLPQPAFKAGDRKTVDVFFLLVRFRYTRVWSTCQASPRPCLEPYVKTKTREEHYRSKGSRRPMRKQRIKENNMETKAKQGALGLLNAESAPGSLTEASRK